MTVDELCLNQPGEFKEFMQYCRGLSFTADPDYTYIIHLFEGCMERNHFDTKTPDFIWNKNRLFLEKEALKQNMMRVIVSLQERTRRTTATVMSLLKKKRKIKEKNKGE